MPESENDQAAYSSKMRWWRQREKQEQVAANRDARLHGEVINEGDEE